MGRALAILMLASCTKTSDLVEEYLLANGHRAPACTSRGADTWCTADGDARFRCVVTNDEGCSSRAIACERYYTDRPNPEQPIP